MSLSDFGFGHQHKLAAVSVASIGQPALNRRAPTSTSNRPRVMAEEPQLAGHGGKRVKGAQVVRQHGTSKGYIVSRLRREGLTHLVAAIESGRVSAFACGVELGWIKRRPILGTGSPNAAKRRRYQLNALLRESQSK
jgi:hypothetical protein